MTLQDLAYFVAVADHGHFGKAARACHVGQPTLSGQLRKLETELGVTLFERNNRRVAITPAGAKILDHARRAVAEARLVESAAKAENDPLAGTLKLGVIPTLAPYLVPRILPPLRKTCPRLKIELWEDVTASLLDRLRGQKLDAALIATELRDPSLTALDLFEEPFFAAVAANHPLAGRQVVRESDLAADLLVLADAHCLAGQARAACGRRAKHAHDADLRASSLETLVQLVAAGYGTTLIPQLAADQIRARGVVVLPLKGVAARTIRVASRTTFPRPRLLQAVARAIVSSAPSA